MAVQLSDTDINAAADTDINAAADTDINAAADTDINAAAEAVSTLLQKAKDAVAATFGEDLKEITPSIVMDVFFQMISFALTRKE